MYYPFALIGAEWLHFSILVGVCRHISDRNSSRHVGRLALVQGSTGVLIAIVILTALWFFGVQQSFKNRQKKLHNFSRFYAVSMLMFMIAVFIASLLV